MPPVRTPDWVKDAVFYQIFPDRFAKSDRVSKPSNLQPWGATPTYNGFQGGDLLGVAEKLDYLVDLGINAIYFNPIFASASNHRYHTHDYYQIDPILGGLPAFREMLDEAHKRGIRIVLDGVFNHSSRGMFQFNHLMECGSESPYVDWFHVHDWPINAFRHDQHPNYSAWWNLHALPKLNTNTPAVREYLWGVGTYWLEQGIDGWRLDVPSEIDDDEFWREFRRRCHAVNPDCYIVGELWDDAHRWLQGDQFDAQMNYLYNRAAFGYFFGDNMNREEVNKSGYRHINTLNGHQFLGELNRINHLYDPEIVQAQLNMLGSHDTPRTLTVANGDKTAVRLAFLCMMTMPGAPNIYYGDEIGLDGGHDPYCRKAFPWHDEDSWDNTLRNEIKEAIALRHSAPVLRRGTFIPLHADHHTVVFARQYEGQTAIAAFNNSYHSQTITFNWPEGTPRTLASTLGNNHAIKAGQAVTIPGREGLVWLNPTSQPTLAQAAELLINDYTNDPELLAFTAES